MLVLKFLQKNPCLQKDPLIWDRLEFLLNNSHQNVKKEILKLLSINDTNTLKYLIDMYDDESADIRFFVFDKICELEDFNLIKPGDKLRLLYVGLSDTNQKVVDAAVRFLKKFITHLKIIKSENDNRDNTSRANKNENLMEIEEERFKNDTKNNLTKDNKGNNNHKFEESKYLEITVHEKIIKASSPLKMKNKLQDSPFRLFDHLDSKRFYNHPKLSYAFNLITAQLIDLIDFDDLVDYVKSIIDNLIISSNSEKALFLLSPEKINKRNSRVFSSGDSSRRAGKFDLFNDVFFLQSIIFS